MLNICLNMQEYDKNMHIYAIVKYAQICTNMQKICKKYAQICNNMQGLGTLQNRQKYANYMHKYAQICNICNQGFHMQNMHEYARICTPHFADVGKRFEIPNLNSESESP